MEETGNRIRTWGARLFMAVLLVTSGVMAGCATTGPGEAREKTIWQLRDQHVKIERQDRPTGVAVPANAHPADISVDRLRSMLESIEVRLPDKNKAVRLFNDDELNILGENIHTALASAGSGEDVTFAIIGHYPVLMGVLKQRMVTTGRVFCLDGQINIIFGDVLRYVRENEDRRLYPLLQGSRAAATPREWTLAAKPGGEAFTAKRPDWITYPIAGIVVPAAVPAAPPGSGSIGTDTKDAPPAVSPEKPAPTGRKSVEERLQILNELRAKQLISEEEYRVKRREILNEL